MKLTVRDAASLLNVTEKTIYRWIKQGVIPAYQISDQYRFNRAELLEWATSRRISVSPKIFEEPEGGETPPPSLLAALREGGIHYRIGGNDKGSVLQSVVDGMKLPEEVDRGFLYQVLLAREALGSTGVGDGIAIPHDGAYQRQGQTFLLCRLLRLRGRRQLHCRDDSAFWRTPRGDENRALLGRRQGGQRNRP